jgi:hypothetical protein
MFDCWWYILPSLPLSISEKEKLGKPKEEIGNLKMDFNICVGYHTHKITLPVMPLTVPVMLPIPVL